MSINQSAAISWKTLFSLILLYCGSSQLLEARECTDRVAWAVSIQGRVESKAFNEMHWRTVQQGDHFCPGDHLRVSTNSRAGVILHNKSLLRLAENSSVSFSAPSEEGDTFLELLKGIGHFISRNRKTFQVKTPYINACIEGTEFTVESRPEDARVTVLEGQVIARNEQGEIAVSDGQRAYAQPRQAPLGEVVVNPRDAVQWALYYPPVVIPAIDFPSAAVRRSITAYRQGDLNGAFTALAKEPGVAEHAGLLVYRASLHLQVGGVESARQDLEAALELRPEQADALALMSLIATAHNDHQQARDLARRALRDDVRSASAYLALSYAQQAQFKLPEARKSAEQATAVAPDNALAWARLAQLELMFQNLDGSSEAARCAVAFAPDRAQSQNTLGFDRLIRFDLEGAREAFKQAASLDQAAPLPRLGLGLVQIREGDLSGGRRQLEIAANLDPDNALIRSYLGKAYYEERRDSLAATQFSLAKRFDELDPTAWFYDAIRKQADNRPIEALQDIRTSIDLNDNRAVYRSRLLLDQDEAARGASQARIYQDLGFAQLARGEAYKSLQTSIQEHSAHRLLADSYSGQPRYEKARLSELLQSQLLQPLNTTPIQPQLGVNNQAILDGAGPSAGGYSEFTPLFTREGLNLQLNAIGGENSTWGDDLILSGLRDNISFSLGQFRYDSDGWRENSNLSTDIYEAFLQYSLSPSTSIQFEYRHQKEESGDLGLKFDPEDYFPFTKNDLKRRFGRIGLHHQFTPGSHFIASAIYQDFRKTRTDDYSDDYAMDIPPYGVLPGAIEYLDIVTRERITQSIELQQIQHLGAHTVTLGTGYYDEDYTKSSFSSVKAVFPLPGSAGNYEFYFIPPDTDTDESDINFYNAYLYSLFNLPMRINLTLGAAFEDFSSSVVESKQVGPKFGISWDVAKSLTIRAAYLESLARPLQFEQTIEQTQVAGFNQRFDDVEGSEIKQRGIGVDAWLGNRVSLGAEFSQRDLQVPLTNAVIPYEGVDEQLVRGYLYWTASDRLGVRLAHEKEDLQQEFFQPHALTTQRTPAGFTYHWPSGWYLDVEGTRVTQKITQDGESQRDAFWNLDAIFGYRFKKLRGRAEVIVKNALNENFSYYDLSFFSGDHLMPKYQPERQAFLRFALSF